MTRTERMEQNVSDLMNGHRDCTDPLSIDDYRSAVAAIMGKLIAHAPTAGHANAIREGHYAYMDAIPRGEE